MTEIVTDGDGAESLELKTEGAEPTLFSVLAERARGHPPAHLWGATLFGAADALAILIAYPAAWWLASAAFVLCAFGVWGLADEALAEDGFRPSGRSRLFPRAIRAIAVVGGIGATLVAGFGLMAAVLGGLIH
ncbi:MAG TPA: hypothetical protein VK922_10745 [Gemmatimonadaceae bacterium]|nr:hypothetical protein [Gemmatimonadaceae bacterium]